MAPLEIQIPRPSAPRRRRHRRRRRRKQLCLCQRLPHKRSQFVRLLSLRPQLQLRLALALRVSCSLERPLGPQSSFHQV